MGKEVSLEINELVQVSFPDDTAARTFSSRIEDVKENDLYLSWPTDGGSRVPLHGGESLQLSFTREDAIYGLEVSVKKTLTQPFPMVVVQLSTPIQRTQRRENVRVRALLPVELIGEIEQTNPDEDPQIIRIKTNTLDISAGGFAIRHKDPIPMGAIFETKLSLPGSSEPIKVTAKVVRCGAQLDIQKIRVHQLGMMFVSISESLRSRIVRYVFGIQNTAFRQ